MHGTHLLFTSFGLVPRVGLEPTDDLRSERSAFPDLATRAWWYGDGVTDETHFSSTGLRARSPSGEARASQPDYGDKGW